MNLFHRRQLFALSRIYAVGNGLALTLTLSPRGKQIWPRWDESLISERPVVLETVSLSPGERAGVRANVNPFISSAFTKLDVSQLTCEVHGEGERSSIYYQHFHQARCAAIVRFMERIFNGPSSLDFW